MYQGTSEYYGDAIAGPNRTFNMKLTENGIDIVDSLKSVQITAGSEEITIGSAVSTYFDATIEKQNVTLSGKEITLQAGIEINGEIEYIPMGIYTIQNPRVQGNTISFTAYDRLTSRCNGGYFSKITYPADALDVLSEIESMTGITVDKTGLVRGVQIQKRAVINEDVDSEEDTVITTYVNPFDGYTYKETIGFIAGLFGKFAVCGRTGNIEFRWYADTGYTVTADTFYDDFEESEEGFILGRLECDTADQTLVSGTGTTGISFSNPVMTQGTLDGIFSIVKDLAFIPGMVRFIGDPRIDLGDIVTVVKNDSTEFRVPVIHILTAYDGGLMQSLTSAGNTESEDDAESNGPITEAVERVSYELAFIKTLMVDNFTATNGTVKNLSGDFLNFKNGEFESLKAQQAAFENITAENFTAVRAEIDNILVGNLDAYYARIDFANIDTAKIKQGFMETLMVSQGIFTSDITAAEGTFTNYLTGVNILANNITAGTLSVERLVITGSDQSIVYEINKANGTPQLSQSTVDGGALTERTVTADRIVAESITGNEIAATTITGQHIVANSITATSLDVNSIFAQDITATGTITGVNLIGATGSFSGNIAAATGTIGPWSIGNTSIWKGNSTFGNASGMYLGDSGFSITDKFKVTNTGELTAANVSLNGSIICSGKNYTTKIISDGIQVIDNSTGDKLLSVDGDYIRVDSLFINYMAVANSYQIRYWDSSAATTATSGIEYWLKNYCGYVVSPLNNNQTINAKTTTGASWSILQLSSSNNTVVGYGGYANSAGDTNVYGNNVNLIPKGRIYGKGTLRMQSKNIDFEGEYGIYSATVGMMLRFYTSGSTKCTALGNNSYATRIYGSSVWSNKSISTSDVRYKEDFNTLESYEKMFMYLEPVTFRWKKDYEENDNRIHFGLKAQQVEEAFEKAGFDVAKYSIVEDYGTEKGLCYNDLLPTTIYMVQKTRKEIDCQIGKLNLQEAVINDLQNRLWKAEKEIKQLKQAAQ